MKRPVAPQSRRAWVALTSCVSVVWSCTGSRSDRFVGEAASLYSLGNLFSQLGRLVRIFGVSGMTGSSGVSKESFISSTSKQAYRLSLCNGGMPLIRCGSKNPFLSSPPIPLPSPPPLRRLPVTLSSAAIPLFRPVACTGCQIGGRSLEPNVRVSCTACIRVVCHTSFEWHRCPLELDLILLALTSVSR